MFLLLFFLTFSAVFALPENYLDSELYLQEREMLYDRTVQCGEFTCKEIVQIVRLDGLSPAFVTNRTCSTCTSRGNNIVRQGLNNNEQIYIFEKPSYRDNCFNKRMKITVNAGCRCQSHLLELE